MSTTAPPLWPQPIPIIGVTGPVGSGKTKFCLSICPGPQTLVYDLEQSSASYSYIGFERIDVQKEMQKIKPNGYKAIDLWKWWISHVRAIPPGKYRVIVIDPVTDLERGLTDFVAENPGAFGHTSKQYDMMSGIMWGDVKDFEKQVMAEICGRCETFAFTTHLGNVWGDDKKPTKEKKPKGKESLMQLASLYLMLSRETGVGPPSAVKLKGRLEIGEVIDGEVVSYEVLPPRLPVATPKAIRDYFKNPAGRKPLTEAEKVKIEVMSEDERLRLETAKAEAEAATAQARADAAKAVQATVVLTAPEGNNDPAKWVTSYTVSIDRATTPEELNVLPTQIKLTREKGYIGDDEVSRLRDHFQARKAALEATK